MARLLWLLLASIVSVAALADDVEDVMNSVSNQGTKRFERIERSGKLQGCDLNFSYTYRDYINRQGALTQINGVISTMVPNTHTFVLLTEAAGATMDVQSVNPLKIVPTQFVPTYIGLSFGGRNIDGFQVHPSLPCKTQTACKGFHDDSEGHLIQTILQNSFKPWTVSITVNKNGVDKQIQIDDLVEMDKARPLTYDSKVEFLTCVGDVFKATMKDVMPN